MATRIGPRTQNPLVRNREDAGVGGPIGDALKEALKKAADEQAPQVGGPIGDQFEGTPGRNTPGRNPLLGGPIGGLIGQQPGAPAPTNPLLGGPISAGLLGMTGGKLPEPTPKERGEAAINKAQAPAEDHPYRQHVEGVHQALRDQNLPDNAEGVRVKVVGDGPGHAQAVARSVGGDGSGIAPGADLSVQYQQPYDARPEGFQLNEREASFMRAPEPDLMEQVFEGKTDLTLDGFIDRGARDQIGNLHDMRQELAQVRAEQPDDGKLTIANMSWGTTPMRAAEGAANTLRMAREGTPLHNELTELLGHPPSEADLPAIKRHLATGIQAKLDGEYAGDLASARQKLGDELKAARGENILFVAAVGNEGSKARDIGMPEASRHAAAGVDNLLLVGSTHLGADPRATSDDRNSDFTNLGANVNAPGDDVPVMAGHMPGSLFGKVEGALGGGIGGPLGGRLPVRNTDGTSFASPYVAGVAALMSKANPGLNADQIAGILTNPAVHNSVAGTSVGGIDPVKAVKMAAEMD